MNLVEFGIEFGERHYRIEKYYRKKGNKSLVKFIGFKKKPEWTLRRNIDKLS